MQKKKQSSTHKSASRRPASKKSPSKKSAPKASAAPASRSTSSQELLGQIAELKERNEYLERQLLWYQARRPQLDR